MGLVRITADLNGIRNLRCRLTIEISTSLREIVRLPDVFATGEQNMKLTVELTYIREACSTF